ncbi:MAG: RNA methyltransferase, partial [Pygmaiobacter sp.]
HVSISEGVAQKLSEMKSAQGVFALCRLPEPPPADIDPAGRYIALEAVQDPANVGAVLRSAAAFGFDGALLDKSCANPFGTKALRASMGAAFKLPLFSVDDLPAMLCSLSRCGMATAAAALRGAVDLSQFVPVGGLVLVIGSEGNGLSEDAINACGAVVKIPISERMESLNAAVAASVLMWEYRRK